MLNTWQISISTFSDAHWIIKFSVRHKNNKKTSSVPLMRASDFSLSGGLSFLLVCFTGNLWFFFTGFNEIENPHLPDLPLLMRDRFSELVSILDVCSEVRHSLSISLLVRSGNLGNFLNLRKIANSSASCFLFKDAICFLACCLLACR